MAEQRASWQIRLIIIFVALIIISRVCPCILHLSKYIQCLAAECYGRHCAWAYSLLTLLEDRSSVGSLFALGSVNWQSYQNNAMALQHLVLHGPDARMINDSITRAKVTPFELPEHDERGAGISLAPKGAAICPLFV